MTAAHLEIERKFRLRAAPSEAVLAAHGAVARRLEQVYLVSDEPGRAERVRRIADLDGTTTYRHTVKRRVAAFSFDEREIPIDEAAWIAALLRADPARRPVRKTRYVVGHGEQTLEIDVFEQPADLVVLEVELRDEAEAVELPAWVGDWREVTGDPRYFNASLAQLDAPIPPFD
jgi:CYTH domain-containing protein